MTIDRGAAKADIDVGGEVDAKKTEESSEQTGLLDTGAALGASRGTTAWGSTGRLRALSRYCRDVNKSRTTGLSKS